MSYYDYDEDMDECPSIDQYMLDDLRDKVFERRESALRKSSKHNPRNKPCPTCGQENVLTPADVQRGYQCDNCANLEERGF